MISARCTIHGVSFDNKDPKGNFLSCPACQSDEIAKLTRQLNEVTEHRDVLLRAIDIKKMVVRPKR